MALASFGTGVLFGTNTSIANSTPIEFGVLQSVDLDFGFTTKPLFGLNQFAVFIARGEAKWTLKAKAAIISGDLFNSIFFSQTLTTGGTQLAAHEAHSVPASTPFTISPTNQATFAGDEGVTYSGVPGLPLTATTAAPGAIGLYLPPANPSTTGVYAFNSSDAGASVLLNYLYTVTTGQHISLSNVILGSTPFFNAVLRERDPKTGLYNTLVLNRLTASKLSAGTKTSDYEMPDFEMEVMDDGTGNIGTWTFGDLS
jgi:hypothetical protein